MPKYMLFLHESPEVTKDWSPEQMQSVVERYGAWSQGLIESGRLVQGEKLRDEGGLHLSRDAGSGAMGIMVADGPYSETKEVVGGVWTIPSERTKNRHPHVIALGPWGRTLIASNGEWVFPAPSVEGPRKWGWYRARDRVLKRMSALAGRSIAHFTPHDFRRTARSNTKRLKVEFETAEAMMNHVKTGLERIYDRYDLDEEKAAWFLKWENEIIALARLAGVADRLDIPDPVTDRG